MNVVFLYGGLFVYVEALYGMQDVYKALKENALRFNDQCIKMEHLIVTKIKNPEYEKHMKSSLEMRVFYLQKDLHGAYKESFLARYDIYCNYNCNYNIVCFCEDVISSYHKYSDEHPDESTIDQFKNLAITINNIIERYLFLTVV